MSNTYFKIETTSKEWNSLEDQLGKVKPNQGISNISLTAFVGGEKTLQLTVDRSGGRHWGLSYAILTKEECVQLAGALLERVYGSISATGCEKSNFCEHEDEEQSI